MASDTEARVQQIISSLRSLDKARELFAELNYDPAHDLLTRSGWSRPAADALAEDPQVMACHDDFKIIYARLNSDRLLLGDERPVVNRHEQDGDSPPQIAATDGFDVRTVRKQIERARQEREVREARSIVLRNAMEHHYTDICNFAEKLKVAVAGEESISLLVDDPLWLALKQHLPHSPLWNLLNRRDTLLERLYDALETGSLRLADLATRINVQVEKITANFICEA